MSRHRNVRNRCYSFEDDYDDHDEYELGSPGSPSMEQFMYRRNSPSRNQSIFSFIEKLPEKSNESDTDLVDTLVAKVQETLGSQFDYEQIADQVRMNNYDIEAAMNALLTTGSAVASRTKIAEPPRAITVPQLETVLANEQKESIPVAMEKRSQPNKLKAVEIEPKASVSLAKDMTNDVVDKDAQESRDGIEEKTPQVAQLNLAELQSLEKAEAKAQELSVKEMENDTKVQINMVIIGHVDAGKSTIMGHLLHRLGYVSKKTIHKYEKESREVGKASFAYAWVMDADEEERARGCTMDIGVSYLETTTKRVTLLDAPGHRDFIPKMIAGASQADVAVLVVPASTGEFEAAFENSGQTKEHTLLVRSLGVTQMIVAINKMDSINWSQSRFDEIRASLTAFLEASGFKTKNLWFVPVSGITGDNLFTKLDAKVCSWYSGPSLTEAIDNFAPPVRPISKPFRLSISDVFKTISLGVAVGGRIYTGAIAAGDKALLMPSGQRVTIKAIEKNSSSVAVARAGETVEIGVVGVDQSILKPGDILCSIASPISLVRRFEAQIMTMPGIQVPIVKGACVSFHIHNIDEPDA